VPKSVLIVDDHEAIRRELRRLFQSLPDFVVCGEAVDGADAISKAEQLSPDLVILDLAMPEMNGLEAAGALRFTVPDAPLFLLTAYKNREVELAAFQSGICAVFSKYDDLNALICRARSELKLDTPGTAESESQVPELWVRDTAMEETSELERMCEAASPEGEQCTQPVTVHCTMCGKWFCDAHAEDKKWHSCMQAARGTGGQA
jgi:DNA-binding NarL/FixJ family response regulator